MLGFSFPYNEDFQICTKADTTFILHTTPILNDCQYHAILVSSYRMILKKLHTSVLHETIKSKDIFLYITLQKLALKLHFKMMVGGSTSPSVQSGPRSKPTMEILTQYRFHLNTKLS